MATPGAQVEVSVPTERASVESRGLLRVEAVAQNGEWCVLRDMSEPRIFIRAYIGDDDVKSVEKTTQRKPVHRLNRTLPFAQNSHVQLSGARMSPSGDFVLATYVDTRSPARPIYAHFNGSAMNLLNNMVAMSGNMERWITYEGAGKFVHWSGSRWDWDKGRKQRSVTYAVRRERPLLMQFFHDANFYFAYRSDALVVHETDTGRVVAQHSVALPFVPEFFWLAGDDSVLYLYSPTQAHKFVFAAQFAAVTSQEASIQDVGSTGEVPLDEKALAASGVHVLARDSVYVFTEHTRANEQGVDAVHAMTPGAGGATLSPLEYVARPGSGAAAPSTKIAKYEYDNKNLSRFFTLTGFSIVTLLTGAGAITIPFAAGFGVAAIVSNEKGKRIEKMQRREAAAVVTPTTFYASAALSIETGVLVATTTVTRRLYTWRLRTRPSKRLAGSDGGRVPALPHTNKNIGGECHGCDDKARFEEATSQRRPFCGAECQRAYHSVARRGTPCGDFIVYDD